MRLRDLVRAQRAGAGHRTVEAELVAEAHHDAAIAGRKIAEQAPDEGVEFLLDRRSLFTPSLRSAPVAPNRGRRMAIGGTRPGSARRASDRSIRARGRLRMSATTRPLHVSLVAIPDAVDIDPDRHLRRAGRVPHARPRGAGDPRRAAVHGRDRRRRARPRRAGERHAGRGPARRRRGRGDRHRHRSVGPARRAMAGRRAAIPEIVDWARRMHARRRAALLGLFRRVPAGRDGPVRRPRDDRPLGLRREPSRRRSRTCRCSPSACWSSPASARSWSPPAPR